MRGVHETRARSISATDRSVSDLGDQGQGVVAEALTGGRIAHSDVLVLSSYHWRGSECLWEWRPAVRRAVTPAAGAAHTQPRVADIA